MMKWCLAAWLAAGIAAPAFAQEAPTAEGEEIVVSGIRDRERAIRDFVGTITDVPIMGQIARFEWTACPAVAGLGDSQAKAIADRMRKVAGAAGIPVGKSDCRPNVLVIAVEGKDAFMESLRKTYPVYFSDEFGKPTLRPREAGPVTAWQIEGVLNANGEPAEMKHGKLAVASVDSSRLRPSSRPHFIGAVVVVEAKALRGLTTTQVADYAAMRAFAKLDPKNLGKTKVPTILSAIDAPMNSAVPLTLTEWDLGYLRGLYRSSVESFAPSQKGEIKRRIREQLNEGSSTRG